VTFAYGGRAWASEEGEESGSAAGESMFVPYRSPIEGSTIRAVLHIGAPQTQHNGSVLDPIPVPPAPPELTGPRVLLRGRRPSDVDDRLAFPIVPEDEDMFGGSWRRDWRGETRHSRDRLEALAAAPTPPGSIEWAVEHAGRCIGWAGLRIDAGNHRASFTAGIFDAALRGRGLGREITALVVEYALDELGLHRVELEVLASNTAAIRCYEAVGFRHEGARRDHELCPDGWRDFLSMALLATDPRPCGPR